MRRASLLLSILLGASSCAAPRSALVESVREVGTVPNPPGTSGRDGGLSARFGGRSVWIFGDTFFGGAAADGYHWRASTWSWTDDTDASDGLSSWTHALGADGKPLALIPHTPDEQAYDDAHNGDPCPAGTDCGARHTAWPATAVVDASGHALVFYSKVETMPTGAYSFKGVGTSIATWASPDAPAVRPNVNAGFADPTQLFGEDEPPWGAAALIVDEPAGETLYAYACPGGHLANPCKVARVLAGRALDRSAWTFFDGKAWQGDWHAATDVMDGAPFLTVHFSRYLGQYLAIYMKPLGQTMMLATAPRPEGPWGNVGSLGEGAPPLDGSWDYGLVAHPELAQADGRVEYLSYFQPGKFLDGVVHLVELRFK